MKNTLTGTIALLVTLVGASYLSAQGGGICGEQIAIITAAMENHCDSWECEFNCEGGELTEVDCECEE